MALKQRICRLERLIGNCSSTNTKLLKGMQAAQKDVHKLVPDEMAAAYKAVALLCSVATLPASRAGRADKLKRVDSALGRAEPYVEQLFALQNVLDRGIELKDLDRDALGRVEVGVCDIASKMTEEEQKVDALLVQFNEVTERLNSAILSMAQALRNGK